MTTKKEIIEKLKSYGVCPSPFSEEELMSKKKDELEEKLEEESKKEMGVDETFEDIVNVEVEDDTPFSEKPEDLKVDIPSYGSEKWNEYVMRQFAEDELDEEGNPRCEGVRRVANNLLGPIMESTIVSNTSPNSNNYMTATVCVHVVINVTNETHPMYRNEMSCCGIADVNSRNTGQPFHMHPSATALTRAEGQALRKMLGIKNKVVAEELAPKGAEIDYPDAFDISGPITEQQVNMMDVVARRVDINILDYVNAGENNYESILSINENTATNMIKYLNDIQRGKKPKPKNVGKYDPSWRSYDPLLKEREENESTI